MLFRSVGKQNFTGCIVPVYPLTAGITNHLLCTLTQQAVGACARDMPETLPRGVRLDHELAQAEFSYRNIHFPESFEALKLARRRLTFEELFYLSAGLAMLKERRGDVLGCAIPVSYTHLDVYKRQVPGVRPPPAPPAGTGWSRGTPYGGSPRSSVCPWRPWLP